MTAKDSFKKTTLAVYREIVRKDCYMMKEWKSDYFDYIIDIGANTGVFTTYAHMRHPQAKIFAYEPCKETFDYLINNTICLDNVEYINEALGDGSSLIFVDREYFGQNQFLKKNEITDILDNYIIQSKSLNNIFKEKNISLDSNYFIKVDCEGGERFLLNNDESISVIKKSQCCSIEVHFPPSGKNPRQSDIKRFEFLPEWKEYNEWFNDNFKETHKIIYHYSSKKCGNGTFVLLKKDSEGIKNK